MAEESFPPPAASGESVFRRVLRQPRVILFMLAGWSILTAVTQVVVNSPIFLDTHDIELDGAIGGFALSLNAVPLAVLYIFCARDPGKYPNVFWLAIIHMAAMIAAVFYHWTIGTFSLESIVGPALGSALLAGLSFLQVFESKSKPK